MASAPLVTPSLLKPQAVLFLCNMNSVRSPIAAALFKHYYGKSIYVASAGVRKGALDPFAVAVMEEIGLDLSRHKPHTLEELAEWEGLNFDLIISLSAQAHHAAQELTRTLAAQTLYWPTPDPTLEIGNREQCLEAYRQVRDGLTLKMKQVF
jgi:protein-tyrosine-phosphatase